MADDDAKDGAAESSGKDAKKKSKVKIIVPAVVVLLAVAGVGYKMGPGATPELPPGASTTTTTQNPDDPPGEVATMDPINVNLADGKYLRIGIAIELGAAGTVEEFTKTGLPKMGDLVIDVFQGQQMAVLQTTEGREAAKAALKKLALETFHEEYRDLFFTDFVMQ